MRISALLVICSLVAAEAHRGTVTYPVYELPPGEMPDLTDEDLSDWEAILPSASLTHNDASTQPGGTIDPSDIAFRVFLGWSGVEQRIYFALEAVDDQEEQGDSFRIAIDGDHSGGRFLTTTFDEPNEEVRRQTDGQTAQRYLINRLDSTGEVEVRVWPDERVDLLMAPQADFHASIFGEQPHVFQLEMAVTPYDHIGVDDFGTSRATVLIPGNIIGFQIQVIDLDPEGEAGFFYLPNYEDGFTGFSTANWDADYFADGELIGCDQPGCSQPGTSVSRNSWGRIKAALAE